jgi:hypothetical protein
MSDSSHPTAARQVWDPFGTIGNALWIGGGQWAGKSTVARLLAIRYGLTAYHCDYHDARAHNDRRIAARVRRGQSPAGPSEDEIWVRATPEQMAAQTLGNFAASFEWVLDDLRALVSGRPILARAGACARTWLHPSSTRLPGWRSWCPPKSSASISCEHCPGRAHSAMTSATP